MMNFVGLLVGIVAIGILYSLLLAGIVMLLLGLFASLMDNPAWALGYWQTFVAMVIIQMVTAHASASTD